MARRKTFKQEIGLRDDAEAPRQMGANVSHWLNEIAASKKREKDFRKEGERILDIYSGKKAESTPFNILFSNTETLLPALYSAIPRPVVQRRFKDDDPLGKAAAQAGQRVLEFLLDTNVDGYETYDDGMKAATLDALLPGRGVTCVKYDASLGEMADESTDDEAPAAEDVPRETIPYKESELACVDTRSWNRVYFGYAKKWSKVPWVAYEEHIDREEATRLFGEEVAAKIIYTENEIDEEKEDNPRGSADDRDKGERKTACIYQIWDRDGGRKVRYVSQQFPEDFLKVEDDPLQLTGFFNCPKPLQFIEKSNDLMPVALYCLYENQAKELNRLTVRINRIVEAIKARGAYDSELGEELGNIMKADDNALVPADKSSSLAAEKGLNNAIWFMPIEQLVATLMQLYQAREQCKRVIYEVTGISDIIRGSSVASETATAQNLKSQWGTLRLKRLQKEVQRYARDLLRMMLEIAATKFSEETWAKMTGLPFVTTQQRQQLDMVAQAAQQQMAQMQTMGQQPNPQQMQQMQQLQAEMAKPVWGQVLGMLRDDMQRAYRIDIETNSTIEPEAAEDQKNISDLMNAMGQYLNGVGPLVAKGVMPFGVAQSMLLAISRRFRFGSEIEEFIKQMQAPKPEDDGKAAAAQKATQDAQAKVMQAEQKVTQMEADRKMLERETKLQLQEIELEAEKKVFAIQKQAATTEMQHKQQISQMQNEKFNTENVVNQKADETLGAGVAAMQSIMEKLAQMQAQLLQVVANNDEQAKQMMQMMMRALTAPRRAVRGPDGRIEATEIMMTQ